MTDKIFPRLLALLLILAPLSLPACSDDDDKGGELPVVVDSSISIDDDQKSQSVAYDVTLTTVTFTTTNAWKATLNTSDSWISIDPTQGEAGESTITVTLSPNETGSSRSATITLTCGDKVLTLSISQSAKAAEVEDGGRTDVMLQAFYWDSQKVTGWTQLTKIADDIAKSFTCIWVPPSASAEGGGSVGGNNVGYHPREWTNQTSCWGTAADLKTMISTMHTNGVKVIADIVINHRAGDSAWGNFTADDFGSYGSYQLDASHICKDDEMNDPNSCSDANWLGKATGAADTGENWSGARDLDHTSEYVQNDCEAYLSWLKGDFGYDGWRYDFCKGYDGKYVGQYNDATDPYLSVGELWDGSYDVVNNWLKATGYKSMAFDFPQKYDALNNGLAKSNFASMSWKEDYETPRPAGLIHHKSTRTYAVTFVDNHDTYRDDNKYTGDVLQAYAFVLSSPGVPCVFWPHWKNANYKTPIENMIAARKSVGLSSDSEVTVTQCSTYYEAEATGRSGSLIVRIGSKAPTTVPTGYTKACSGTGWAFYTK